MKTRKLVCKFCGKEFETTSRQRTCCSVECSHKYGAKVMLERGNQFKPLYKINHNFLDTLGPIQCWFLGIMASDGYINSINKTIGISQSGEQGLILIKYIKDLLNFDGNIYKQKTKGQNAYKISFSSNILLNKLKEYNIVPNKTKTYIIPDCILNDDNKLKWFLWGYIDGDGSIGVYNKILTVSFICNLYMFEQLKNKVYFKKANLIQKSNVKEIKFNGINAVRFCEWMYDNENIFKWRKYIFFKDYYKNMFDISVKMKYNFIREQIFNYLDENNGCIDYSQYAKDNDLTYHYVYKVVKEYKNKGKRY